MNTPLPNAPEPRCSRLPAYATVSAERLRLAEPAGLLRAAVGISQHVLTDANADHVEHTLRQWTEDIAERSQSGQAQAMLANLHHVMFDVLGFRGHREDYYAESNSYLPTVVTSRRGIPISLSLVYVTMARWLGLDAVGLNTPGHFLVRVSDRVGPPMIVDPFHAGRLLTEGEVASIVQKSTVAITQSADEPWDIFAEATPVQWLSRICQNLIGIYSQQNRPRDVAAMLELQVLLNPADKRALKQRDRLIQEFDLLTEG